MSEFTRILATLVLAANPLLMAGAMSWRPSPLVLGQAVVVAGLLLVVVSSVASPLLDALSIEPETFRVAAGVLLMVTGAAGAFPLPGPKAIPAPEPGGGQWRLVPAVFPMAWPGMASAGAVAAALNYGANDALQATHAAIFVSAAITFGVVYVLAGRYRLVTVAFGRLAGAALVVLGVSLIVSGVKAV